MKGDIPTSELICFAQEGNEIKTFLFFWIKHEKVFLTIDESFHVHAFFVVFL